MNYLKLFLSLLSGFYLCSPIHCDSYLPRADCSLCRDLKGQVSQLRSSLSVLKYRLENIEQNVMKNSQNIAEMDRRLQMLETKPKPPQPHIPYAANQYDASGAAGHNGFAHKPYAPNPYDVSGVGGHYGFANVITAKDYYELKYLYTVLNNKVEDMEKSVKKLEEQPKLEAEELQKLSDQKVLAYMDDPFDRRKKNSEQHNIMDYLNGKGGPKVCTRNLLNQKLECSDLQSPTNCADSSSLNCSNNKCLIRNQIMGPESFLVACEDNFEGGGWTVIQRRLNGSVDFNRHWSDYKQGFGDFDGEFWIGLDKLHALTTELEPVELVIQLKGYNDEVRYARYETFLVGSESSKYLLKKIEGYSGTAGDTMTKNKWYKFSTMDKDNGSDCPVINRGAWWYSDCLWSNLNGVYYGRSVSPDVRGVFWRTFYDYVFQMKYVQMMIRPRKK